MANLHCHLGYIWNQSEPKTLGTLVRDFSFFLFLGFQDRVSFLCSFCRSFCRPGWHQTLRSTSLCLPNPGIRLYATTARHILHCDSRPPRDVITVCHLRNGHIEPKNLHLNLWWASTWPQGGGCEAKYKWARARLLMRALQASSSCRQLQKAAQLSAAPASPFLWLCANLLLSTTSTVEYLLSKSLT